MKTVLAPRASVILYDFLLGWEDKRPFLLPANICPIVPITFFKARVPFEFIDISPQTLHMDLDQAEARLRRRKGGYAGLLYAHTYGESSTPHDFFGLMKGQFPDLAVVDDRCLCIPDLDFNPSTVADMTLYSTGYAKIIDLGLGGYAFLQDKVNCPHHTLSFHHADLKTIEKDYKESVKAGKLYSYHDNDWLQTDADLPMWPEYVEQIRAAKEISLSHRQSINAVYNSFIPPELYLADGYQLWRFNLRVPDKKKTLDAIFDARLFASSHYASLAGIMATGVCPNARKLADQIINLFNDHHYTTEMAEKTAHIVLGSL